MKVAMQVTVESDDVLKAFSPNQIVDHFNSKRDVDDLLQGIGVSSIIRYLRENYPVDILLNEMAEVNDIEPHIAELRLWALKQKQAVG